MSTGFSLADRLRYRFDNYMARGTTALIGGLGMISLIAILAAAAVLSLGQVAQEGAEPPGFVEAAWESLMRALDSGAVGGDTGWSFRLVMFCVTFFGIFVLSTLIGVLNTGIEAKLDELRKGRSRVIERGHTVILGWSDQVFPVVAELVVANANQKDSCIVVMGEKDKIEMEDELRAQVGATGRTRVVCRTGNPIDLADLDIVRRRPSMGGHHHYFELFPCSVSHDQVGRPVFHQDIVPAIYTHLTPQIHRLAESPARGVHPYRIGGVVLLWAPHLPQQERGIR